MKLRTQSFATLVACLATACIASEAELAEWEQTQQGLDTQGFFPGRGYLMNADTVTGDCVVPAAYDAKSNPNLLIEPVRAANTGGQEVVFALSKVESSEDLQNKLHIGASAAAKFLIGGGEAKFNFSEETRTVETAVTLVASLVVRNTSWTVPPGVKLHPDAAAMLKAGNTARFRERCGDGFLHSYTTGGEFYAVIQINTSSKEEKQRIDSHIEGNYLTISGSVDFEKSMQKIVKNSSTTVRSYQIGGANIDTAPCRTVSCIADRVSKFTTAVAQAPVVFTAEVLPYDVLEMPGDGVSPLDISVALDSMRDVNAQRNAARDQLTKFLDVQSRPERYALGGPNATFEQVTAAISTINGNLTKLGDALKACARDTKTCLMPSRTTVAVQPPPAKRLFGNSSIRSYAVPSEFLAGGAPTTTPALDCSSPISFPTTAVDRPSLPALNIVPGLLPSPKPEEPSVSLQTSSGHYFTVLKKCIQMQGAIKDAAGNSDPLAYAPGVYTQPAATNLVSLEAGTFYIVPGLNGKPNTYSFRRYVTTAPPSVYNNSDPDNYLVRYAPNRVRLDNVPPTATEAAKDTATWYIDAL